MDLANSRGGQGDPPILSILYYTPQCGPAVPAAETVSPEGLRRQLHAALEATNAAGIRQGTLDNWGARQSKRDAYHSQPVSQHKGHEQASGPWTPGRSRGSDYRLSRRLTDEESSVCTAVAEVAGLPRPPGVTDEESPAGSVAETNWTWPADPEDCEPR